MNDNRTLVLGASPNPERYAHKAVMRLLTHGHSVVGVGLRTGKIGTVEIQQEIPVGVKFHTVTLYLGPTAQKAWQEKVLAMRPARIIFNPGTENRAFEQLAKSAGIEVVEGCTLVMLASGQY